MAATFVLCDISHKMKFDSRRVLHSTETVATDGVTVASDGLGTGNTIAASSEVADAPGLEVVTVDEGEVVAAVTVTGGAEAVPGSAGISESATAGAFGQFQTFVFPKNIHGNITYHYILYNIILELYTGFKAIDESIYFVTLFIILPHAFQ